MNLLQREVATSLVHDGAGYYFCSAACAQLFTQQQATFPAGEAATE